MPSIVYSFLPAILIQVSEKKTFCEERNHRVCSKSAYLSACEHGDKFFSLTRPHEKYSFLIAVDTQHDLRMSSDNFFFISGSQQGGGYLFQINGKKTNLVVITRPNGSSDLNHFLSYAI